MSEDPVTQSKRSDPLTRPEVRWGVGCLLGGTALAGLMIITLILAFALSPPVWLQILLGLGLVGAAVSLAILVNSALASSTRRTDPPPVPDPSEQP